MSPAGRQLAAMGGVVINEERPATEQGDDCDGRGGGQHVAAGQTWCCWSRRLHREAAAGERLGATRDPLPLVVRVG